MKNFRQVGDIFYASAGSPGWLSGDVVVVSANLFGIAETDCVNAVGAVHRRGVFAMSRSTGTQWTQGQNIYWDTQSKRAIQASASVQHVLIGVAVASPAGVIAGSTDATGDVLIK